MGILLVGGFFRSLEFTAINVAHLDITAEETSRATAFSSMMQQLLLSAGVAPGADAPRVEARLPGPLSSTDFSIALTLVGSVSMAAVLVRPFAARRRRRIS